MITNGPTRIVLLHSGKYDFAEVELDRAVHLVAHNNVGKTTLIAALQFLYIDSAKQMDFAYDLAATRKYYFPGPFSYVLFECLTPKGLQVLGVHGQGPVQSYHYERFRYTGELRTEDYLDEERRPRSWDDVRARLAGREFELIQPRELPTVLTGLGSKRTSGNSFGIVPVRQNTGYDRFRRLFAHLLKLGKLRQEDLKQILIDTWQPDLVQREIDLEGGFRTRYDNIRRQREQVDALTSLLPLIERATTAAEAREELREMLPALWAQLQASARSKVDALSQQIEEERRRATGEMELAKEAKAEAEVHRSQGLEHEKRLAVLNRELTLLDEQALTFRGYELVFEDASIQRLEDDIGELEHKLRSAKTESLPHLRRDLALARENQENVQRRLNGSADLVVTFAREHMSDSELAKAFAVLNPELLGEAIGDGVEISDPDQVLNALRRMAKRSLDGSASLPGVILSAGALKGANIKKYGDPESLREQFEELSQRIADLETLEQTLVQQQTLQDALAENRSQHVQRVERRSAYRTHIAALETRAASESERSERERAASDAEANRLAAFYRGEEHAKQAQMCSDKGVQHTSDLSTLREDLRGVEPPHWPSETSLEHTTDTPLPTLFREYHSRVEKEAESDSEVRAALDEVERITYDQYSGGDEAQTLNNLRDARDALTQRKESLRELWTSLVVGLKSAFKSLGDDLDTLNARINGLNRALSKTSVSNLDQLALRLERNKELGKYVKDVQTNEAMPLFGSPGDAQRALERIGDMLRARSRIRLEDMFDLHFEITTPDGMSRKYPHLDRIESNGTTVTIKVLVSLHLLRALLTDAPVRIPFFLDEVASLDRRNLRGIVEAAEELGFCPILASPEASDAAEVLYYLREGKDGRIVLHPESAARVEIRRGPLSEV